MHLDASTALFHTHTHTENQSVNQLLCVMEPESIIDFPEQKEFFTITLCSLPSFGFTLLL